ncbi:PREDICTED: receptor-type guanylate cyclase gcy-8-like [Rhagoletis zephyria]|uniref:receptor-type guanylate cyclase gcy-8-like n=1 Tax=Rhagoletis zephyria TaxID=28612 RepID=UPI000811A9F8|nr:PREDICTED: receptor-type guanylate cyclase gcy-8-like [Rhagoletis zephyria]XP_017478762.1 PREDICTED: receptor-type guanylate cyclase gcy-8-like [Rhagoletis zephyria]
MIDKNKVQRLPAIADLSNQKYTLSFAIIMERNIFGTLRSSLLLCWLAALALLFAQVTRSHAIVPERQLVPSNGFVKNYPHYYDYNCFTDGDALPDIPNIRDYSIGLQVSDRALHQVMSRIFAIVLREKLNYRNISLVPYKYTTNISIDRYEENNYRNIFEQLKYSPYSNMSMINVAVWMPALVRSIVPDTIIEAGTSITPGRFGWFVPKSQVDLPLELAAYSLHYSVFLNQSHADYGRYVIPEELIAKLRHGKNYEEYISPSCLGRTCVTLLAEHKPDTAFVMHHIQNTSSFVNVLWLGADFRETLRYLHQKYQSVYSYKRFIVLHWTPSIVIDGEIEFYQITLPHCEDLLILQLTACKYELTPVLKYYDQRLGRSEERLVSTLREFQIHDHMLQQLQLSASWKRNGKDIEDIYNHVACDWLKSNERTYTQWLSTKSTIKLYIGGIFPLTDFSRGHQNLEKAVKLAVEAVNRSHLLKNYNLDAQIHDGQCKPDEVMKVFIHYFTEPRVLGVLGPACSETVEPIAGISKHTNMAVISYSAEGATFADRQAYPYFFRTIGSNRQYEDVYIELMKVMGWKRVAALTEDGQKYTEYISHMEAAMKQHNLELITNKKFLSDVKSAEMNKYLLDLKQKHAKIIIADIHNRNAELALCEAYNLGMTAYEGYVWFLPSWISKDWNTLHSNHNCTTEQLQKASEGHFSIMHTPFGDLDSTMQENITVRKWLQLHTQSNVTMSNYTGFAYDAVWAYAHAAARLLAENDDAVNSLRSSSVVARFVELIWQTNFTGLSGQIQFGQGGSRITDLDIVQWRQLQFERVGKFKPYVVGVANNRRADGGRLDLFESKVVWLSGGQRPTDGTYDCSFAALAKFLNKDCESAAFTFTAVLCILIVVFVSLISFLFWKKLYDKKLKQSAKIMKNFGIDLLSPSRNKANTLDKWEVPKENVVLNRRLGEGAFGTVYGGEAQIGATGWTAVAVKTLKAGASTEDRLDFLSEAEAMKRFNHKNIVKMLGVCLQTEPIYTIMEFMLYGDLKTYLLARRHLLNEKVAEESDISSKRLTMYAMDVARGLAYLASQKYVHRDLACRNCLVDAQRVVKIGDFGMARSTYESDYYRFNRKGMLPVRWMAPESLALGMFTPSSDVWAFGVVLYEIITFGSFPYQGLTNNQAFEYIKSGKTLQIPSGAKPPLEGLIKACWSQESKKRPTAAEVVDYISNYPRLLTPCLDFPSASVEMPETESDQLELPRKCSPLKRDSTLDILAQTSTMNHFNCSNDLIDGIDEPKHTNIEMPTSFTLGASISQHNNNNNNNNTINAQAMCLDACSATTPDGYSIMSPLLMHRVSECSDSSQARLIKKSSVETLQQTEF